MTSLSWVVPTATEQPSESWQLCQTRQSTQHRGSFWPQSGDFKHTQSEWQVLPSMHRSTWVTTDRHGRYPLTGRLSLLLPLLAGWHYPAGDTIQGALRGLSHFSSGSPGRTLLFCEWPLSSLSPATLLGLLREQSPALSALSLQGLLTQYKRTLDR